MTWDLYEGVTINSFMEQQYYVHYTIWKQRKLKKIWAVNDWLYIIYLKLEHSNMATIRQFDYG